MVCPITTALFNLMGVPLFQTHPDIHLYGSNSINNQCLMLKSVLVAKSLGLPTFENLLCEHCTTSDQKFHMAEALSG
jgi:hypothetical protein